MDGVANTVSNILAGTDNNALDGDYVYNDKNGDGAIDTAAGETDGVFIL